MRAIQIKQHDLTDCGAACLASVAAYYKLHLPLARIRQYAGTDKKGTNLSGLMEAATKLGFQAKGVKGSFESLTQIPLPCIAHVVLKPNTSAEKEQLVSHHYVVIYHVSKNYIRVMDPIDGRLHRKSHEDFRKEWTGVLLLLLPDEGRFKQGNEKISFFRRFWTLLTPHKTVMLQALAGAITYTVLGLSTSVYIQKITDSVLVEGNKNLLNLLSVAMIVILAFQLLISWFKSMFMLKTGQQIDARLILGYYKHLMRLPQTFFDTMQVGEIISRVNDAVKIRAFINDVALNLVVNLFIVFFSFALMFTYYWKLAFILTAIIPLYGVVYFIANQINKRLQRQWMESSANLEIQLVESLNAAATIKRFGLEEHANLKTEIRFVQLLRNVFHSGKNTLFISTAGEFLSRLFTIILLWTGSYFVIDGELTPGELLSFYTLVGYFTLPATNLLAANKSIQEAVIATDRLFEIMDLEREENENKVDLTPELIGDIQFKNVSFRYGTRQKVFDKLSFTIPKGSIVAIIGESGSGKSTLLSLLQNLYPLSEGNITLGQYDIRYVSTKSLRHMVSVVPQQIDLFSTSILENIAVGDHTPNMQKVLSLSAQLGISEFIEKLPGGFNALLGENGINLSGGERQRLAIARALYRNPEILILDEATSSLDSISEQYVQTTIENLRKEGKTVLIIAHRLSTIKNADKIIALENGQVMAEGTHEQLLEQDTIYSKLWRVQFGM
ncbi:peptidase domain-containing ABC transporter [Xanthocytophaga agilis]|nr:peptidase domain-containing ABC transporter [Xanthocytophaga agilis]